LLDKIDAALTAYEEDDSIDKWSIEFAYGIDYKNITRQTELIAFHKTLDAAALSCRKMGLLIKYEKGRLYHETIYQSDVWGTMSIACRALSVCKKTIQRYIHFYEIVNCFPRILITGLPFDTILHYFKKLSFQFHTYKNLHTRLQVALKETNIVAADITIFPPDSPSSPKTPPTIPNLNAREWMPGWEERDILESMSDTEEMGAAEENCLNDEPGEMGATGGLPMDSEGNRVNTEPVAAHLMLPIHPPVENEIHSRQVDNLCDEVQNLCATDGQTSASCSKTRPTTLTLAFNKLFGRKHK